VATLSIAHFMPLASIDVSGISFSSGKILMSEEPEHDKLADRILEAVQRIRGNDQTSRSLAKMMGEASLGAATKLASRYGKEQAEFTKSMKMELGMPAADYKMSGLKAALDRQHSATMEMGMRAVDTKASGFIAQLDKLQSATAKAMQFVKMDALSQVPKAESTSQIAKDAGAGLLINKYDLGITQQPAADKILGSAFLDAATAYESTSAFASQFIIPAPDLSRDRLADEIAESNRINRKLMKLLEKKVKAGELERDASAQETSMIIKAPRRMPFSESGQVTWHDEEPRMLFKDEVVFKGTVPQFLEVARDIAVDVWEQMKASDPFASPPLSVDGAPRPESGLVTLYDSQEPNAVVGWVLAIPHPQNRALLKVEAAVSGDRCEVSWRLLRDELVRRGWIDAHPADTSSDVRLAKAGSRQDISRKRTRSREPWERIPDHKWDRKAVEMMCTGSSDAEIARAIGGVTSKTITNRLASLRTQFPFIPTREKIRRKARHRKN
jgi:hypothetical protein